MARFDQMASVGSARRGAVLRQRIGSATILETASVVSDDGCADSARDPAPRRHSQAPARAPDLSRYSTKDSPFLELGNHLTKWYGSMAPPTHPPSDRSPLADPRRAGCIMHAGSVTLHMFVAPVTSWQLAYVSEAKGAQFLRREAAKMALLLPLLLPRIALFVVALVAMAVISSVAGCGWCVIRPVTLTHVAVSMACLAAFCVAR